MAKGKQGKLAEQKSVMRSALSTVRATVLEGSLGNEKNHYLLSKVKAKTEATEIAWIFFGMMIANSARQGNAGKISFSHDSYNQLKGITFSSP